jgi:hypothetical protein
VLIHAAKVYIPPVFDATGMEIMCFDSLEEAQTKLNSLKLGEIDEALRITALSAT